MLKNNLKNLVIRGESNDNSICIKELILRSLWFLILIGWLDNWMTWLWQSNDKIGKHKLFDKIIKTLAQQIYTIK